MVRDPEPEKFKIEITEEACEDTLRRIIEDFEEVRLSGSEGIKVLETEEGLVANISLKLKKWIPVPEFAERLQEKIYESFLLNTGLELKKINVVFESFFEG